MVSIEGVTKFTADHTDEPLASGDRYSRLDEFACELIAWREILYRTGLVGQDPDLYDGAGYGNVSARIGPPSSGRGRRRFLVTGTQTSGRSCMDLHHFCLVESYDYHRNRVVSRGQVRPSSESLTHGALYDVGPQIRCVLHAHSPVLWRNARRLRLAMTDPGIEYGSVELALAVGEIYRERGLAERPIFAMGGHEDGIVVFGRSPAEAGRELIGWLARAYEFECRRSASPPSLCTR